MFDLTAQERLVIKGLCLIFFLGTGISFALSKDLAALRWVKQAHTPPGLKPLNINAASIEQLDRLPGIGPALAKRIVDYRQKNGTFKSVEGLRKVKGITNSIYKKIEGLLLVHEHP